MGLKYGSLRQMWYKGMRHARVTQGEMESSQAVTEDTEEGRVDVCCIFRQTVQKAARIVQGSICAIPSFLFSSKIRVSL